MPRVIETAGTVGTVVVTKGLMTVPSIGTVDMTGTVPTVPLSRSIGEPGQS